VSRERAAAPAPSRAAVWGYVLLALAGVVAVGRLAMDAWLERPVPHGLPRIGGTAEKARPLLVVVVDGLSESAMWGEPTALPFLHALAEEGASGIARAGNPTLTAACVRTLLTGQWPDLLAGLKNFDAPPVEGSWLEFLRERGARPAHGGDAAIAQLCVLHLPPADVLAFPDRGPVDQGQCDAEAVPFVLGRIEKGCDVVTLHLTAPDHAGHKHGASGAPYRQACANVDAALSRVVRAFRARHPAATVLVAADHGVSAHGTHGGGEPSAQRAPFVLVGPGVARRRDVLVPQASLAPTLCALLGLPQPPLAQAPPATELLALPAGDVLRALDAHVQARAWVARAVGSKAVDPIDRKRAELALRKMGPEGAAALTSLSADLEALARPTPGFVMTLVLLLAVLGLAALVAVPAWSEARATSVAPALAGAALFASSLVPFPGARVWGPACVALVLAGLASFALLRPRLHGSRGTVLWTLAPLLALPPFLSAWNSLRDAEERGAPWAYAAPVVAVLVLLLVGGIATVRRRAPAAPPSPLEPSQGLAHPLACVALVGALLGGLLSLRPLVDPFVSITWTIALLAWGGLALALRSPAVAAASSRTRPALLLLAAVLLFAPRFLAGGSSSWIQALPLRSGGWALGALALLAGLVPWLPRSAPARRDRLACVLGLLALGLAWAGRLELALGATWSGPVRLVLAFGPQLAAFAALLWAGREGSTPAWTFVARALAALALARRLTASDAEVFTFTLFVAGALLASRLRIVLGTTGWASLAMLLVLLRTAVFHAMGGVESFSTIDVGAGFLGLEWLGASAQAGPGGVTVPILLATLQVGIRFALLWLVLFATLSAMGVTRGDLRRVTAGLALTFAARATALLLMLWAFAANAWWVEQAYTVYALGAADLVLLLLASVSVRAFAGSRLHPSGAAPMIPPCSA
jgi:ethanolaminephosphotransferase